MQILNITPYIRPSKSLTSQMFPIVSLASSTSGKLFSMGMVLRDVIKDVDTRIYTSTVVHSVSMTLREPLIQLPVLNMSNTSTGLNSVSIGIRDVLISTGTILQSASSTGIHSVGMSIKTVLITAPTQPSMSVTTTSLESISMKLT